ncbi:hypothetical protein AAC387_Pa03g3282 [Persea americana]
MALTAKQSVELRRGGSPATAVPFFGQENCSGLCVSVWMPAMISTPMKISKQRDREPQIFFVSGEGDCETKQSGSFVTKNWAAINALRLSPSLGTVNPKETRPSPSWHKLRHKRIICLLKRRTLQTNKFSSPISSSCDSCGPQRSNDLPRTIQETLSQS